MARTTQKIDTDNHTSNGQDMLIGWILQDIKALWDTEGFGSDKAVSKPLYARLTAAIDLLQKGSGTVR